MIRDSRPLIKILIADDHARSREGLRALLAERPEIEVVGEASDGLETIRLTENSDPDVVLTDARMAGMDGLEATRQIKTRWPGVRVVVLTMYPVYRGGAIAAGADAFVLKGCPSDELLAAIEGVGCSS